VNKQKKTFNKEQSHALSYIQLSIINLCKDFNSENYFKNPVLSGILSESLLLDALVLKGDVLGL